MMTEAEKRLKGCIIERKNNVYDDYKFNIDDDIEAVLNMLEEVRNRCNYLLNNDEVEINGSKYFKHSCDDVITRYILESLGGEKIC